MSTCIFTSAIVQGMSWVFLLAGSSDGAALLAGLLSGRSTSFVLHLSHQRALQAPFPSQALLQVEVPSQAVLQVGLLCHSWSVRIPVYFLGEVVLLAGLCIQKIPQTCLCNQMMLHTIKYSGKRFKMIFIIRQCIGCAQLERVTGWHLKHGRDVSSVLSCVQSWFPSSL